MLKLVIFLVIVGFSAIQSIIKSANEKAEKQKRLQARRDAGAGADANRKQRVQSEIESFLAQSGGGPSAAQQEAEARRKKLEARQRREAARQRAEQEKQRRKEELARKKAALQKERRVGSGISEHVNQYINQHVNEYIDDDVEEYVEATVIDSVERHLGKRETEMPSMDVPSRRKSKAAAQVAAMLRDRQGVRNAILVNEILSRPRALR